MMFKLVLYPLISLLLFSSIFASEYANVSAELKANNLIVDIELEKPLAKRTLMSVQILGTNDSIISSTAEYLGKAESSGRFSLDSPECRTYRNLFGKDSGLDPG